jgi:hypothetical protein
MGDPETIELDAEYDRIVDALEDTTDRLAGMDETTDEYDVLDQRASRLETHRRGIEWVRDEWDVDSITLRPLTIGDDARLDEHTTSTPERRLWQIAIGTVDAPYLEHDAEEYPGVKMDAVAKTVATIDDTIPIAVGRWLQDRIDGVSSVGNRNAADSYARLLTTKRAEETSTME